MNEWPEAKTANGVTIVPGLAVVDYNGDVTTVVSVQHTEPEFIQGVPTGRTVTWFNTANNGLFDGSRMVAI